MRDIGNSCLYDISKESEKYNQLSSSFLGTKAWARINIIPLESCFEAQINIPLNSKFAYGATVF